MSDPTGTEHGTRTEHGNGTVLRATDSRGVATVTLNRPDRNNAYNGDVIQGLIDAFTALGADPAVRVVVLRGEGRHFQAGADLGWLKEIGALSPEENVVVSRRTASAIRGLTEFPKPTIALVHGGCFGGGTGMVAAADIVIASEDAVFAITEARWGVMAGIIVPHLNAAIGVRQVRRWALTCERFGAEAARDMGLAHHVCPKGELDTAAAPIIDALLMSAPDALAQTKRRALIEAGLVLDDDHFEALVLEHSAKRQTDEAFEGLDSFREKRDPAWYTGSG
jgi:methylglutaconyl-CoA hydratase